MKPFSIYFKAWIAFTTALILSFMPLFTPTLYAGEAGAPWTARWISHREAPEQGPVVLHFRKILSLKDKPAAYRVHVSADNRYTLFVNGVRVGSGPATSEPKTWRYATYDLAPYLKAGDNVLAAVVWNYGPDRGVAQMTVKTGFFLQGATEAESEANTSTQWQVEIDAGRAFGPVARLVDNKWIGYYIASPEEFIDGRKTNWLWRDSVNDTSNWTSAAIVIETPEHATWNGPWSLTPDPLPAMRYRQVDTGGVVRTNLDAAKAFPGKSITLAPHSRVNLLIDRKSMISAYPELIVSGGKDSEIKVTYSESLYDQNKMRGNRDAVEGRDALGVNDHYIADGGSGRVFAPLWWRTWRYINIEVITKDSPLTLDRFTTYETGYPFEAKGWFRSSDPDLDKIWDIGWRTAQIDAHETYMDTAYWEQLQYVGDTRLQALISYDVAGDDRLAVQAINALGSSIGRDGFTQSRYPSNLSQLIPEFSLAWIGMAYDHYMRNPDASIAAGALPGIRRVLDSYRALRADNRLLTRPNGWDFIDHVPLVSGKAYPYYDASGVSCATTIVLIGALHEAEKLELALGDPDQAQRNRVDADASQRAVRNLCWDKARGLFADTPEKVNFSQHTNTLAVLYGVAEPRDKAAIMKRIRPGLGIAPPEGILPSTYYFAYYISKAEEAAGLGDHYPDLLKTWKDMLKLNFTTLPETAEPTRSDTHAWSAHPTANLMEIVGGIQPGSAGYASVAFRPHLGNLTYVDVGVPHRRGMISAKYKVIGKSVRVNIHLPAGLTGTLYWKSAIYKLKPGETVLTLPR